jgi:hypothetical protein
MSEKKLIDDAFYVDEKKYGLWYSTDKEGNGLITSLTEESCISATRFLLQFQQENKFESKNNGENVSKYSGSMDYKL